MTKLFIHQSLPIYRIVENPEGVFTPQYAYASYGNTWCEFSGGLGSTGLIILRFDDADTAKAFIDADYAEMKAKIEKEKAKWKRVETYFVDGEELSEEQFDARRVLSNLA